MAERIDEWPRCHSCLYNWCPKKSDECRRCDAVIEIMIKHARTQQLTQPTPDTAP